MPKKKPARNGFYFFMQDILPQLRQEGRVFPNGMADVVPIAHPRWKSLSAEERERYDNMAKEEKKKMRGAEGDKYRLDNVGNIIADRRNEEEENKKRCEKHRKIARARWPPGDAIMHEKFYFIAFETLCETEEGEFLPAEIGVVEYSMSSGITKTLHRFIEPGPIPLGYRFTCKSISEDTHRIPMEGFEKADKNYRGLWIQLENFVNPNGEKKEYPPLYCLESDRRRVDYCVHWLHAHAAIGMANRLQKIFELEGAMRDLYAHNGDMDISWTSATSVLTTSAFDFEANTRCDFHEEEDIKFCALGTVKRYAYAISDALANIYEFELTPAHLPQRSEEPAYTMVSASVLQMADEPGWKTTKSKGRQTYWEAAGPQDPHTGTFGGRDIRYKKESKPKGEERPMDPNDPSLTPMQRMMLARQSAQGHTAGAASAAPRPQDGSGLIQTMRTPLEPAMPVQQYQAPAAPWATRANPAGQELSQDVNDWPALGAQPAVGTTPTKYAGRASAPPASEAPRPPASWQTVPPGVGRGAPRLQSQAPGAQSFSPYVQQAQRPEQPKKKTLAEAVREKELREKAQQAPQSAVTPPRPQNAWGRGTRQVGAAPSAPQPNAWGRGAPLVGSPGRPPPGFAPMSNPEPSAVTQKQVSDMFAGAGRGRGRGVWNRPPNAPVPGVGRGLNSQMAGLHLNRS